ncbi:MAG: DeoR/GlpR family DNA-binding transcription regulator [Chitinophagaceae bacterium]
MKALERHKFILDLLKKEGFVKVIDLADMIKTSTITIRKDLLLLEKKRMLYRSHGGASFENPYVGERKIDEKTLQFVKEKEKIAKEAKKLVTENNTIFLSSGSSILSLAKELLDFNRLTVVTNSIYISEILINTPNMEIVQLGGIIRKTSGAVIGHETERMIKSFSCSKLFMSVGGIDLDTGITNTSMMEVELNKSMLKICQHKIILADSSKFGKKGLGKICDFSDIDVLITDKSAPANILRALQNKGVEVIVV